MCACLNILIKMIVTDFLPTVPFGIEKKTMKYR